MHNYNIYIKNFANFVYREEKVDAVHHIKQNSRADPFQEQICNAFLLQESLEINL